MLLIEDAAYLAASDDDREFVNFRPHSPFNRTPPTTIENVETPKNDRKNERPVTPPFFVGKITIELSSSSLLASSRNSSKSQVTMITAIVIQGLSFHDISLLHSSGG